MAPREPLFSGNYDPNSGWSNTRYNGGFGTITLTGGPDPSYFADPYLQGSLQFAEASTETGLERSPVIVWDTNFYYRCLGIGWPYRDATVKQMRHGYMRRGGLDDDRMTYALKQLRSPETRREYDAVPLGAMFLDKFMEEWLKKRAITEAAKRAKAQGLDSDEAAAMDILKEWGFGKADKADKPDDSEELPELPPTEEGEKKIPWMYSYYLWRSSCDDTERLARWQQLLLSEFVRVGMKRRFAVGYMGRQPQDWVAGEVQGKFVAFLREHSEPTQEMAADLVATLTNDRRAIHA